VYAQPLTLVFFAFVPLTLIGWYPLFLFSFF
jgi:hypothetical protein